MKRVRHILVRHFIGAVACGFLAGRAVEIAVGAVMPVINTVIAEVFVVGPSVLSRGPSPEKYWGGALKAQVLSNLILASVYAVIVYLLGNWLYSDVSMESDGTGKPGAETGDIHDK
jgi:hypothetical protein